MSEQLEQLELRFARLEDQVDAIEREVQTLREEFRAFAHVVGRGEVTGTRPASA